MTLDESPYFLMPELAAMGFKRLGAVLQISNG